jgi:plastocyanin
MIMGFGQTGERHRHPSPGRAWRWQGAVARTLPGLAALALVGLAPGRAAAQAPASGEVTQLRAEMARLEKELRDQKQLILQLMQVDQQRYDVLLQLIRSLPGAPPGGAAALPSLPGPALPGAPASGTPAPTGSTGATGPSGQAQVAMLSGRVQLPSPGEEAYIYVEGRGSPRPRALEIRQEGKQFTPAVSVVPVGSRVTFPNADTVFHNVFSRTPGAVFDLGTVKGGETSPPVTLLAAGHVEVFCNIHSKMRADILVVPNGHYTKVRPDGSFVLANVPVGSRKLVLWGPRLKPATQTVDVHAGATVKFTTEAAAPRAHLNKQGRAYPSYE